MAVHDVGDALLNMERRKLGRTDIVASVLGFGGSEIGYQSISARTVARLLGSALDAGLNVIDTAECYDNSESLIGKAIGARRGEVSLFTKCGHAGGWSSADWRHAPLLGSIERSLRRLATDYVDLIQLHSCSLSELKKGEAIEALERARERGWARYIGYSGDGEAARYAVECGRFDTLQTSVSIADQDAVERTLPLANVAWTYERKPAESYYQAYWSRLRKLDYPFLKSAPDAAVSTALRFTLSVPGIHTAIVGTTKPERWQQNAELLRGGALSRGELERIRARWREVAGSSWDGQV